MIKPFEKRLYVVVCKNKRQAKNLYERLLTYWRSSCGGGDKIIARPNICAIHDPVDAVMLVPERRMFYVTSRHHCTRAYMVNGDYVDRFLSKKEKEHAEM